MDRPKQPVLLLCRNIMARNAISEHEFDLALAAELQSALLPKACPHDCPHQITAARNRMCAGVGGDFYDFLRLNVDQFALVIGDVVGHGVRASLVMAQIMGFLHSGQEKRSRPTEVITGLNEMLMELGERTGAVIPCSVFYAVIDSPTGICFYVNAGHPRSILCDRADGSVRPFGSGGMLLGVEEFDGQEMCHTFMPGQRLVMYTDGITEAALKNGDQFGSERLGEVIVRHAGDPPEQLAEAVLKTLDEFRAGQVQQDDETIVVVDRI